MPASLSQHQTVMAQTLRVWTHLFFIFFFLSVIAVSSYGAGREGPLVRGPLSGSFCSLLHVIVYSSICVLLFVSHTPGDFMTKIVVKKVCIQLHDHHGPICLAVQ